jgi:hypothetical protein
MNLAHSRGITGCGASYLAGFDLGDLGRFSGLGQPVAGLGLERAFLTADFQSPGMARVSGLGPHFEGVSYTYSTSGGLLALAFARRLALQAVRVKQFRSVGRRVYLFLRPCFGIYLPTRSGDCESHSVTVKAVPREGVRAQPEG